MRNTMECPICDGKVTIKSKREHYTFRKKDFEITAQFYECEQCKESFSDTTLDERNIQQVYNLFRQENNILFPQEIQDIRIQYNLSRRKISQVLGWGENTYANYEKGVIPDESHNNLLRLMKQPDQFFQIVENKRSLFSANEYRALQKIINELLEEEKTIPSWYFCFDDYDINEFTGFLKPKYEKLVNTILYFLEHNASYVVRLNKLMFYTDFLSYKFYKKPITGYHYAAIPMGPVLQNYKILLSKLENDEYITTEESFLNQHGEVVEKFVANKKVDNEVFSEEEFSLIESIHEFFKDWETSKIVKCSHEEKGWIDNKDSKALISYQKYADELQLDFPLP